MAHPVQKRPISYSPATGSPLRGAYTASQYRDLPGRVWSYNPWTGKRRNPLDIDSDPSGLLIIPPGEALFAFPPEKLEPGEVNYYPPVTPEEDDLFSNCKPSLEKQIGGSHYKDMKIQPVEYIHANGIGFVEGSVIKYVSRWRNKNGVEDLKKARHFLDLLIELESAK